MLRTIDLRGRLAAGEKLDCTAIVPRADFDVDAAVEVVVCDKVDLVTGPGNIYVVAAERQVTEAKHNERMTIELGGHQSAVVLVDNLDQGVDVVNAYAAEHLELHTADAERVADRITNAGAIFGSTHVLPTAGCACHSSGLNVKSFLKAVHVISYNEQALRDVARHVEVFAESEDLLSHGAAVTRRVP